MEILAENKRLSFIGDIAVRYQKLYQLLNKEEKITIISAENLSQSEQDEVLSALKANPSNEGKEFKLEFTVDPAIKGGLQMYTETEFMDMSLASRLEKLKSEVNKFVEWSRLFINTTNATTWYDTNHLFKQQVLLKGNP